MFHRLLSWVVIVVVAQSQEDGHLDHERESLVARLRLCMAGSQYGVAVVPVKMSVQAGDAGYRHLFVSLRFGVVVIFLVHIDSLVLKWLCVLHSRLSLYPKHYGKKKVKNRYRSENDIQNARSHWKNPVARMNARGYMMAYLVTVHKGFSLSL